MAYMIARENVVKRRIDKGGMTKFDWRSYCGIESIYKMTTSVLNPRFATPASVHSATSCLVLVQYLQLIRSPRSQQRRSAHGVVCNDHITHLSCREIKPWSRLELVLPI